MTATRPSFIDRDYDAIKARMIADYEAKIGRTLNPMEPSYLKLETLAYEVYLIRCGVQDASCGQLVQFSDLPVLELQGAYKTCARLEGEGTEAYRQRVIEYWDILAAGRPTSSYIQLAKAVSADIIDVRCYSEHHSGVMKICILHKDHWTGTQLTAEQALPAGEKTVVDGEYLEDIMTNLMESVRVACQNSDDRPGTDLVEVELPEASEYTISIEAYLHETAAADYNATLTAIEAAVQAYCDARYERLGLDAVRGQIEKAALLDGVHLISFVTPAWASLSVDYNEFAYCTAITITLKGVVSGEQ